MKVRPGALAIAVLLLSVCAGLWWALAVGDAPHDVPARAPDSAQAMRPTQPEPVGPTPALSLAEPGNLEIPENPELPPDFSDSSPMLASQTVLEGRVTTLEHGLPVSDVMVMARFRHGLDRETRTAAEGTWRMSFAGPRTLVSLTVEPGEATSRTQSFQRQHLLPGRTHRVDLTVSGGATVRGVVVGPTGQPLLGAEVWAWCRRDAGREVPDRMVQVDGQGRFRIDAVGPDVVLQAFAPRMVCTAQLQGSLVSGQELDGIEFRMLLSDWVKGEVVTGEGEAVASAVIEITYRVPEGQEPTKSGATGLPPMFWQRALPQRTTSDQAGRFRFLAPPEQESFLDVRHDSFRPWQGAVASSALPVRVVLDSGCLLAGLVVDASHQPIAGASVHLFIDSHSRGHTDAQGRFEFRGLPPRVEQHPALVEWASKGISFEGMENLGLEPIQHEAQLAVTAPGYALHVVEDLELSEDRQPELLLVLEPGLPLGGRVVDGLSNPIAGREVFLRSDHRLQVQFGETSDRASTYTDALGRFGFQDLPAGQLRLSVHEDSSPEVFAHAGDLDVLLVVDEATPGDPGSSVAEAGRALEGQVIDDLDRSPVSYFKLSVRDGDGNGQVYTFQDADGRFTLEDVPPKIQTLEVQAPGYALRELIMPPGAGDEGGVDLLVSLRPARQLALRVLAADGTPAAGAAVQCLDANSQQLLWLPVSSGAVNMSGRLFATDERGELLLQGLPAGLIEVRAAATSLLDGPMVRQQFDLLLPLETRQTLVLPTP